LIPIKKILNEDYKSLMEDCRQNQKNAIENKSLEFGKNPTFTDLLFGEFQNYFYVNLL
jgi:hypothetical protein